MFMFMFICSHLDEVSGQCCVVMTPQLDLVFVQIPEKKNEKKKIVNNAQQQQQTKVSN